MLSGWEIALIYLGFVALMIGWLCYHIRADQRRLEELERQEAPRKQAEREYYKKTTQIINEGGVEAFWKAYGRLPVWLEVYHAWYQATPEQKARILPYMGQMGINSRLL
jgi:hypothetical protein